MSTIVLEPTAPSDQVGVAIDPAVPADQVGVAAPTADPSSMPAQRPPSRDKPPAKANDGRSSGGESSASRNRRRSSGKQPEVAKTPCPASEPDRDGAELQRLVFVFMHSWVLGGAVEITDRGRVRLLTDQERELLSHPVPANATPRVVGEIRWLISRAAAVRRTNTGTKGRNVSRRLGN